MKLLVMLVISAAVCVAWGSPSSGKRDAVGILTIPTPGTIKTLTTADITSFVNKHREFRSNVADGASNMEIISWDINLANQAASWVSTCLFHHPHSDNDEERPYKPPGQNLYRISATGDNSKPAPEDVTTSWHDEKQWYNIATKTCSAPSLKSCGHYIQVVWANTKKVGCGIAYCENVMDDGEDKGKGYVVACNYGTGVTTGAAPYTTGAACTQCESGIGYCVDNTCVGSCSAQDASQCSCEANCNGNGVLDADACTCTCNDGYTGADCSKECKDNHSYCGASPGWPFSWCALYMQDKDTYWFMEMCPRLCQWCDA